MHIKYFYDLEQGSDEWFAARCGLLTASEMKLIITPAKLQAASNDKQRAHLFELVAQRITNYVEPQYIGDDMLRGIADEVEAKILYSKHYTPTSEVGFVTNNKWGFTLGYSPDALVGDDGQIECKSRRQKYQIETIAGNKMPDDYLVQVQTGLLVTEREWCDFVSYSAGLPMFTKRIYADEKAQEAIVSAAKSFYDAMEETIAKYEHTLAEQAMWCIPTERKIEEEITL